MVRETGNAEVLKVESDFPTPTMGPGQVIVKNQFAGINFIDTYHRSGLYARDLPFVGGQEGGGTVAAVSEEAAAQGIRWETAWRIPYSVLMRNTPSFRPRNFYPYPRRWDWMWPHRVWSRV